MTVLQTSQAQNVELTLQELRIELLRDCPLLCVHCSAYAAPHHNMHLPLQRVFSLINEFADGGGRRITFTGGEPLMYTGIEGILQHSCERGLQTRLFSSGITYDATTRTIGHSVLNRCAPFLDTIMYSVYSTRAEAHDQITRISGSFGLTVEAIKYTLSLGARAELHFVPTLQNYQELSLVVELAAALCVPRVGIIRFVPQGRGKARAHEMALHREAHQWLRETIITLRKRYPQVTLSVGSAYNLLGVHSLHPCTAGINQLVIEADGRIIPCSAFSGIRLNDPIGNILQQPLQIVWKHSLYLQEVRRVLASAHACNGCLAQKTIVAGHVDAQEHDPIEEL
ncbi:MAG TPA: radical SAM protein [Ktedonobacteraceae bacterium]